MYLYDQIVKPGPENARVWDAPYSPMTRADATKAAHRLVNVVDATTNRAKPL